MESPMFKSRLQLLLTGKQKKNIGQTYANNLIFKNNLTMQKLSVVT